VTGGRFLGNVWHYEDPEAVWADVPKECRPPGWDRQAPRPPPLDLPPEPRLSVVQTFESLATCRLDGCGLRSDRGDGWCSRHRPHEQADQTPEEDI
jgi:hypothetical protein